MGYYTTYNLKWQIPDDFKGKPSCEHLKPAGASFCPECGLPVTVITPDEAISRYLEENSGQFYGIDSNGDSTDSVKWYEHDKDLKEMSREFPGVLFILHGEGEEPGDLWNRYYLHGRMQEAKAEITYDVFDPKKLE